MNSLLSRWATPLTVGFFAVSAISGVALFFHLGQGWFHEMHEWLSMMLLAPFVLHVWKNWRPLVAYVQRGTLWWPVAAALVIAVAFAVQGGGEGHKGMSPQGRAVSVMTQARLADLAPVLKTTPEALQASLIQRGYKPASADDTLDSVAASSGTSATRLLFELLQQ